MKLESEGKGDNRIAVNGAKNVAINGNSWSEMKLEFGKLGKSVVSVGSPESHDSYNSRDSPNSTGRQAARSPTSTPPLPPHSKPECPERLGLHLPRVSFLLILPPASYYPVHLLGRTPAESILGRTPAENILGRTPAEKFVLIWHFLGPYTC